MTYIFACEAKGCCLSILDGRNGHVIASRGCPSYDHGMLGDGLIVDDLDVALFANVFEFLNLQCLESIEERVLLRRT